jgi:hypothetical protein
MELNAGFWIVARKYSLAGIKTFIKMFLIKDDKMATAPLIEVYAL